jgi:hypothetical protein
MTVAAEEGSRFAPGGGRRRAPVEAREDRLPLTPWIVPVRVGHA